MGLKEKTCNNGIKNSWVLNCKLEAGAANPSPPVGPALGAKGVNIMEFCKQFNARTQDKAWKSNYQLHYYSLQADKSFEFVIKTPPAAVQLMEAAKVKKGFMGSQTVKKVAEGYIGIDVQDELPKTKMPDLNCFHS